MTTQPPSFVDWMLGLPVFPLGALVIGVWVAIALLVDWAIVPWLGGPGGRKLGRFEPEVASQLGLVFGLLLSFNAVTIWEQSSNARDAVLAEASALREIADLSSELSTERRRDVNLQLQAYLRHLIQTEWPRLASGSVPLDRPVPLRALSTVIRSGNNEELRRSLANALDARETRIRIASYRMLPARWSLVVVLGVLTVLAVGLVHAEHRRARAIAVGLVSFGIACCFLVLFLHARPFLGVLALRPTELSALATELAGL